MKLRDLAEIVFTNALFVAFAMLIFAPAYAAEVRHILSPDGKEAAVFTDKPCVSVKGVTLKPEMMSKIFIVYYVYASGKLPIPGCYMETQATVQMVFDDGDQYELPKSVIKPGKPIFGTGV